MHSCGMRVHISGLWLLSFVQGHAFIRAYECLNQAYGYCHLCKAMHSFVYMCMNQAYGYCHLCEVMPSLRMCVCMHQAYRHFRLCEEIHSCSYVCALIRRMVIVFCAIQRYVCAGIRRNITAILCEAMLLYAYVCVHMIQA